MTPPSETEEECDHDHRKEFLKFSGICEVSGFQVEALAFEVTKEPLDTPTFAVKGKSLLVPKSVADDHQVRRPGSLADRLAGKEKLQSKSKHLPLTFEVSS